ncbi:MAG: hypothetical protein CML04_11155 [Pseudozobellia sp.]|nr:hypothetical protein [Pseudozobellia sp.]MBG50444.1 hypothetical protein [Pseudozobellia sp.]|tara:strand:- start:33 stop:461 length:429 start_codon:yes stop_codon:yes gene_type:complete
MKRYKGLWAVIFVLCLSACSSSISEDDLEKLNGYWEIREVQTPDGTVKQYNVNTTVDYFEIKELEGFRKKMQPKFDGTYETSDDAEKFQIVEEDGMFWLHYKSGLSEWKEKIIELKKATFSVENEEGIQYEYSRFEPISIIE